MLTLGTTGRVYLAVDPQDGRKGIDGLAGVVTAALGRDPASGDLFIFRNRTADRVEVLYWARTRSLAALPGVPDVHVTSHAKMTR